MPRVNVKYKLSLDPIIGEVLRIKFEDKEANYSKDKKSDILYEGSVKNIIVSNKIFIDLILGGFGGEWSLEVQVIKLNTAGKETGDWKKLKTFPIKGDVKKGNQRRGNYEIKW